MRRVSLSDLDRRGSVRAGGSRAAEAWSVERRLRLQELTGWEWQLLGLLAQSMTVAEVAERLGVGVESVAARRALVLAKLARRRGFEAAQLCRLLGGDR